MTYVRNAGKRTIVDVVAHVRIGNYTDDKGQFTYEGFHVASVVHADEEMVIKTPRGGLGARNVPSYVTFQDADGRFWIRNLIDGKLDLLSKGRVRTPIAEYAAMQKERRRRRVIAKRVITLGRSEQ